MGINYWESKDRSDRRLLFQMNSYLQAIDARTGKSIMTFGTDGVVNLRDGLRRDPATLVKVQSSNPGKVFENLIILGSAAGEHYMAPPGDIRAYDVVTGQARVAVPHRAAPGRVRLRHVAEGRLEIHRRREQLGRAVDRRRARHRLRPDRLADLRLLRRRSSWRQSLRDVAGGARRAHRQTALALPDGAPRPLGLRQHRRAAAGDDHRTTASARDIVAQAGKTGYLYVFDRVTGEPIWPIEERRFPASEIPGEKAWPTQPIPTAPPPFARQSLTVADINPYILTTRQRTEWEKRIGSARNEGLFTPPSFRDTVSIPGAQGGANWGTTAADPARGLVYVLGINVPSIYKLSAEAPRPGGLRPVGPAEIAAGRAIYEQRCQSCHGGNMMGSGNYPSLVDVVGRLGGDAVREKISGGGPGMPPSNDLTEPQLASLVGFLANPSGMRSGGSAAGAPELPPGPVVASGGAPAGQKVPEGRPGGMVGPDYPKGVHVPEVRMYTGYGMNGTIVKPPYSTLTAYDLNTGTIKWQVPAGGDDAAGDVRGRQGHRLHLPAHRDHHDAHGVAVPGRRGWHPARLRRRHRQVLWTAPIAGRVARDPGDVRSQRAPVLPGERHLVDSGGGRPSARRAVPAYVAFALPEAVAK